ncbi:MAG: OsmC family protein [Trueperaceae bacterium]
MANTQTTIVHQLTGKRFVGIDSDGLRVMIDGEESARTGMRPMQLVLNAVGACAAYDIVEMIRKRKIELRSYRVELTGERAEGTPSYYTRIMARHVFDAPGLERAIAERFVDLGMNKYCSVASSLKAEMEFEVVLEHEATAAS